MKLISNVKNVFVLLLMTCFLFACQSDTKQMLTKKWKMENEEVTVDFHNNGSYTFVEGEAKMKGEWQISEDGKVLILKEGENGSKNLTLKELSDERLVISDNGDDMIFTAAM